MWPIRFECYYEIIGTLIYSRRETWEASVLWTLMVNCSALRNMQLVDFNRMEYCINWIPYAQFAGINPCLVTFETQVARDPIK